MKSILIIICFAALTVSVANALLLPRSVQFVKQRSLKLSSFDQAVLIAAEVATKPDGYVYGAVSAPDWVLPAGLALLIIIAYEFLPFFVTENFKGAVFAILTAALPVLLSSGEKVYINDI
jgi:hypothetical protein